MTVEKTIKDRNLTRLSATSSLWLFSHRLLTNAMRVVTIAVLARHLHPEEFGLAALALVTMQFIILTEDNGIATYIVCDREKGWEERIHSAFWLNLLITFSQVVLILTVMNWISVFFNQPKLIPLLQSLALLFVFKQLQVVPNGLIRKFFKYDKLVIRNTLCDLFAAIIGILMAIQGFGVWCLILPSLFIEPFRLITTYFTARWYPKLIVNIQSWPSIVRYSLNLMGANIFNLILNDGDTLLVSKFLGTYAVGLYSIAWQLSNILGRNITSIFSTVATSSLASLNNDNARISSAYLKIIEVIGLISFPFLIWMWVMAEEVIFLLYGSKWQLTIPILRVFIIFTIIRSVTVLTGVIFNVTNNTHYTFITNLCAVPVYCLSILFGLSYGVIGVATGVTICRIIIAVITLIISNKVIDLSTIHMMKTLAPVTIISLITGCVSWCINWILVQYNFMIFPRTLANSIFTFFIYISITYYFNKSSVDLLSNLRRSWIQH